MLTSKLFVEALVEAHLEFIGSGAKSTDLIEGTLLIDNSRGGTGGGPTRSAASARPKGATARTSSSRAPTSCRRPVRIAQSRVRLRPLQRHPPGRQSPVGSDYRILSAGAILSGTGAGENDIFPIFLGDGTTTIQWNPIIEESEGSDFLTHSGFINDNWRLSDRLTANVGIRFDKNHGADQSGNVVAKDSAWSPRLGIVWDPNGQGLERDRQRGQHVAAISNPSPIRRRPAATRRTAPSSIAAPASTARTTTPVPTAQAIRSVFDWFFDNGGPERSR